MSIDNPFASPTADQSATPTGLDPQAFNVVAAHGQWPWSRRMYRVYVCEKRLYFIDLGNPIYTGEPRSKQPWLLRLIWKWLLRGSKRELQRLLIERDRLRPSVLLERHPDSFCVQSSSVLATKLSGLEDAPSDHHAVRWQLTTDDRSFAFHFADEVDWLTGSYVLQEVLLLQ